MDEEKSAQAPLISYRRAAWKDVPMMEQLDRICFPPETAFTAEEFVFRLAQRGCVAILAEQDRKPVALVLASSHRRNVGHIDTLDVHPDLRRRGIGRALLEMAEEELIRQGVKEILLQVAVDNEAGLALYRSKGYSVKGRLSHYYGWGKDAYLMKKVIGRVKKVEE